MSTKYLVTGAAGNLGSSVIHELVSSGKDVRALVLPNDKLAKRLPKGIEIVEGDVLDVDSLGRFFSNESGDDLNVMHCAGIVSIDPGYNQRVYDVNVNGTKNIIDMCAKRDAERLVYVSTVHAIPELPAGEVMTEVDRFDPDKVVGFYGKTKAIASQLVLNAAKDTGINASIAHPSGIIGPNDYGVSNTTQLLMDIARKKLPAGIEGGYNFVDVRDVAKGIVACSDAGKRGECYILGNRYVSVKELIGSVQDALKLRKSVPIIPVWLAKAFLPFFSMYYKAHKQKPLFTAYSLHTLTANGDFAISKAQRELDYAPRPFEQTIRDSVAWLKSIGLV